MLNPDQKALLEYIEETAPNLPVSRRIKIYRGMADCLEVKRHRIRLLKKVRILEEAERRCAELHFEDSPSSHDHNGGAK